MVSLDDQAIARVLTWDIVEDRALSLRHALIHRRPGLLGDHPRTPRSVLHVRETEDPEGWHIFGAGVAEPAVAWLARLGCSFSLLAPESWEGAIRRRSSTVLRGVVETWVHPMSTSEPPPRSPRIVIHRLNHADARSFAASSPRWALHAWGDFDRLIDNGAAFGVPTRDGGFAALAWIFEADHERDALAVATEVRFQRLGLGRAAASALVGCVTTERRRTPLWTVSSTNLASKALARSLGFSIRSRESVLRWYP